MKYGILKLIEENKGNHISGESISQLLGVSRAAVWKYIEELRREGYGIEASSRKGYRLTHTPDVLNEYEIGKYLKTEALGRHIVCFDVTESTNDAAKRAGTEGAPHGTLFIAEKQTKGRGRLGRTWDSGYRKGIWMSLLLRPSISPEDVVVVTLAAAVAVVLGIRDVTGLCCGIKWPNDIIAEGKKLCGILTEMNSEMEKVNYLVIGAGINYSQEDLDFPPELRGHAVSLMTLLANNPVRNKTSRSIIVAEVLNRMEELYNMILSGETHRIIDLWKEYTITLGKRVRVISIKDEYMGVAMDITGRGGLLVNLDEGVLREFTSGEVSIRDLE